jgi:hypothetical protein
MPKSYGFNELDEKIKSLIKLPLSKLLLQAAKLNQRHETSAVFYTEFSSSAAFNKDLIQKLIGNKVKLLSKSDFRTALWIPAWDNSVGLNQVLGELSNFKNELNKNDLDYYLILPDPLICLEKSRLESISLEEFLMQFSELGECETQAVVADNTMFALLRRIMTTDVKVRVAIDVSLLEDPFHVLKGPDVGIDDNLGLLRLCNEAYEIQNEFEEYSSGYSVHLTSSLDDSKQTLSSPFAVPLLRLICLLRHIFPSSVLLTTTPSLVGRNLYLLLDELGVSSLCEGALNIDSSEKLNLPLLSEISELKYSRLAYAEKFNL